MTILLTNQLDTFINGPLICIKKPKHHSLQTAVVINLVNYA